MINLSHKVIARRELNMAPLFSLFLAAAAFLYMCRNSQQLSDPNVPSLGRGEEWDDSDPENWHEHDTYELDPSIDSLFNRAPSNPDDEARSWGDPIMWNDPDWIATPIRVPDIIDIRATDFLTSVTGDRNAIQKPFKELDSLTLSKRRHLYHLFN